MHITRVPRSTNGSAPVPRVQTGAEIRKLTFVHAASPLPLFLFLSYTLPLSPFLSLVFCVGNGKVLHLTGLIVLLCRPIQMTAIQRPPLPVVIIFVSVFRRSSSNKNGPFRLEVPNW